MDSNTKIVILVLILVLINFFIPNVDHFENNSNSKFKIYNSTNKVYLQISGNNTLVFTPDESKASLFKLENDIYIRYRESYINPTGMLIKGIKTNYGQNPPNGVDILMLFFNPKSNDNTIYYGVNRYSQKNLNLYPDGTHSFIENGFGSKFQKIY